MPNPYQSPENLSLETGVNSTQTSTRENVQSVISGQKRIIYSILINFVTMALLVGSGLFLSGPKDAPVHTPLSGGLLIFGLLLGLFAGILACTGILRIGKVLFPGSTRYIFAIGVLIPVSLISLIVMVVANSKATRYLRENGIAVGFFGARQSSLPAEHH